MCFCSFMIIFIFYFYVSTLCLSVHHKHQSIVGATSFYDAADANQTLIPIDVLEACEKDEKFNQIQTL